MELNIAHISSKENEQHNKVGLHEQTLEETNKQTKKPTVCVQFIIQGNSVIILDEAHYLLDFSELEFTW